MHKLGRNRVLGIRFTRLTARVVGWPFTLGVTAQPGPNAGTDRISRYTVTTSRFAFN